MVPPVHAAARYSFIVMDLHHLPLPVSRRTLLSAMPGEFNRSTQHYSLEHSSGGAGAIPPLRAKILDTALVSRAVGRRLPPIGRSSGALRALPLASA